MIVWNITQRERNLKAIKRLINMDKLTINIAFGNCVFLNRKAKSIEGIISSKFSDSSIGMLADKPNSIKVETIDAMHDKLSLLYDNKNVEGTITWRHSQNGKHYIFSKFE